MKSATKIINLLALTVSFLTVESFSTLEQPASFLTTANQKRFVNRIESTSLSKFSLKNPVDVMWAGDHSYLYRLSLLS